MLRLSAWCAKTAISLCHIRFHSYAFIQSLTSVNRRIHNNFDSPLLCTYTLRGSAYDGINLWTVLADNEVSVGIYGNIWTVYSDCCQMIRWGCTNGNLQLAWSMSADCALRNGVWACRSHGWRETHVAVFCRTLNTKPAQQVPFFRRMPPCHTKTELWALSRLNTFCCLKKVCNVVTITI